MARPRYRQAQRTERETDRLYGTQRWRIIAKMQLAREPLCATCLGKGITCDATVADHNPPHRGDVEKFWHGPLQSLCKRCHDRDKQREEARGYTDSTDADGWPTDPRHPANAHVGASSATHGTISGHPGGIKSLGPSDPRPAAPNGAQNREMTRGGRTHG